MPKLRIYGDSFASDDSEYCWPNLLANKLGYEIENFAVGGSCIEYSIYNLLNDHNNQLFSDNDIIIFVQTAPGRLNFTHQILEKPNTSSSYINGNIAFTTKGDEHSWYYENKKYIEWWLVNQNYDIQRYSHEAYISLIKDLALNYPNILFLVLPITNYKIDLKLTEQPSNFLRSTVYLDEISYNEILFDKPRESISCFYSEFTKYTKSVDIRNNHLTKANGEILASALFECIMNRNLYKLNASNFYRGIVKPIKNLQQYLDDVEKGFYPLNPWVVENLFSSS
jgi:hypothetical protein